MIKIPESDLAKKLQVLNAQLEEEDADVAEISFKIDKTLANAWKQLTGEARDALDYLLAQLEAQFATSVQQPALNADARNFVAGQLNVVYQIQAGLDRFVNYDGKLEDYQRQFGDPDAVEGLGDETHY